MSDDDTAALLLLVLWRIKAALDGESPMERRDETGADQ